MVPPPRIRDVSEESAPSGNAGRAHVHPGIRSDHSTIGVIDREDRVDLRSEIAAKIEGKVGAPADRAATVADRVI